VSSGGNGEEPGKRRARHQQAAAAGAGAGIGAIMGGPVGAIAGAALGPLLEPFAQKVWAEVSGDGRRRGGEMLAAAHHAIGGDVAELERQILASDQSRLQAGIALSAATRTAWPPKVIALGRALAAGLVAADDARIMTEPFIIAALADIEVPHASLLDLLVRHWPLQTAQGVVADPFTAAPRAPGTPWGAGYRIWLAGDIMVARPALRPVLPSLLGTLQRHGLAAQSDDPGDPFGRSGRAMQQRWISEVAEKHRAVGGVSPVVNAQFYAPAGAWLPTELGEEVLDALLEAGAAFEA
jgi:hypothetical protein